MAFFLPHFSGLAVGYFFGRDAMETVFIGLCVAITALPVSIRILMDLGKINSDVGQKIISVAIFDDVLALTILGIFLNMKDTDMSLVSVMRVSAVSIFKLLVFLAILYFSYSFIKRISNKENYLERQLNRLLLILKGKESLYALFFAFVLLFATMTETLGFHFIIGSFFNSLAMGFLAPIFFAGIGLEFQISSINNYGLLVAVLVVSYLSKIIGGYLGGTIAGLNKKVSLTLGIGLNARGIMELVIANIDRFRNILHLGNYGNCNDTFYTYYVEKSL
jgi:Kef-type K+ transport system membrane component KefB